MDEIARIVEVVDAIDGAGIPYMIVGSFSTNLYAPPRSTNDLDLLVQLEGKKISQVLKSLPSYYRLDPQLRFESATGTMRQIVEMTDTVFRFEFFWLRDDSHDLARFARRRKLQVPQLQREFYVATAEDLIITKLRWIAALARKKDTDDIANVMAFQGPSLDYAYIEHWCRQHGTWELLCQVRDSIPPELLEP